MNKNIKQVITGVAAVVVTATGINMHTTSSAQGHDGNNNSEHKPTGHVDQTSQYSLPYWVSKMCSKEYSVDCHWVAPLQGNHKGHSFIVHEFRNQGHQPSLICIMYTERSYAATHDYCTH